MMKKMEMLPPMMPNFAKFKILGSEKEPIGISIEEFTEEEAIEYGELMKQSFIKHWKAKTKLKTIHS